MKNECAKTRPSHDPYEIWQSKNAQWTWHVLKKWQIDDDKPYARWFCKVYTPFTPDGEMEDVFVAEIKQQAIRIK